MTDLYLVMIYAFFYIVNSYGLGLTAQNYTTSLNISDDYSGLV